MSHKLLLKALGSLKSGLKSGTAVHKVTRDSEGMVKALMEMASFCDRAIKAKEDNGEFLQSVKALCLFDSLVFRKRLCNVDLIHLLRVYG